MASQAVPSEPTKQVGAVADQWPSEATEFIVRTVGTVRDKTTGPAITAARGAVFGMFAALVGAVAALLGVIALVRVITVYMPGERVWPADLIVGGLLSVVGLLLWARTRPSD